MLRHEDCRPGVQVECINDDGGIGQLKCGAVYTIRYLVLAYDPDKDLCGSAILLDELCEIAPNGNPWTYGLHRFRLLPSDRLDVFRAMLEPKPDEALRELVTASGEGIRDRLVHAGDARR